jgi:hypothetical protein
LEKANRCSKKGMHSQKVSIQLRFEEGDVREKTTTVILEHQANEYISTGSNNEGMHREHKRWRISSTGLDKKIVQQKRK